MGRLNCMNNGVQALGGSYRYNRGSSHFILPSVALLKERAQVDRIWEVTGLAGSKAGYLCVEAGRDRRWI